MINEIENMDKQLGSQFSNNNKIIYLPLHISKKMNKCKFILSSRNHNKDIQTNNVLLFVKRNN